MKNSLLLIFTVIFSSCTLSLPIISKNDTKIDITYDYYYLNDSKLLLDVSALIPYEELIFTKDIDSFYSDIVYSVKLRDKNNDMLYSDSWSDLIRLQYFEKTTSSKDYISDYTLILDNNMFKDAKNLYIEINDYENHKYWVNTIELDIKEAEVLSNLVLLVKKNNGYIKLDHIEQDDYEQIDTLWVKYQIIDDAIDENGIRFEVSKKISNLEKEYRTLVIDKENINQYDINLLPIPISDISSDNLKISCYYKDIKKETFTLLSKNSFVEYNYEILLNPIGYLLQEEDYMHYMDLTKDKKIEYILNYWEDIDEASLLSEFYSRVVYTNLKFKSISGDGSDSDKGKIYIIYGKPFDIEYRIGQNGDYQEIWIYRDQKFIFINRYGYYECSNC